MSEWLPIENAIVSAVAGLTASGQAMLATVKGHTWRDRKLLAANLVRERLPAAYVMAAGRNESEKTHRRPAGVMFAILYAVRGERRDDEARTGGTDVVGMFGIAEAAAAALQDLDLGENRRLLLVDERPAGGEEGTILWEQRFEVRRKSGSFYPTFGGYPLIGESSVVQVEIGALSRSASVFAFPGVDGVFERFVGTRERPIVWRGQLRAADDGALNEIEDGLELLIRQGQISSVADPWARMFEGCVVSGFKRVGPRGQDDLTGEALQDFELEFLQLSQ